jgi:hypothetical protein
VNLTRVEAGPPPIKTVKCDTILDAIQAEMEKIRLGRRE